MWFVRNCKPLIVLAPTMAPALFVCLGIDAPARADTPEGDRARSMLAGMFISQSVRAGDGLLGGGIQVGQRWDWIGFDFRASLAQMATAPRAAGTFESRSRTSAEVEVFVQKRFWRTFGVFGGVGGIVKDDFVRTWTVAAGELAVQKESDQSLHPLVRIGFLTGVFELSTAVHFVGQWEILSSVGVTLGR